MAQIQGNQGDAMEYPVFFSWQSDLPKKCNRRFIREALDEAVRRVVAEGHVEDSPRVDDGMDGISGTPEVASVMFQKIDKCALFVADTTLVGTIPPLNANDPLKRVPNPNVSLEMGYAAGRIGWDRIICVMNEAYGERKDLPFDVRNRRFPIDYNLHADTMERKDKVQADLIVWLVTAISTAVQNENRAVDDAIERLDAQCVHMLHANKDTHYFHIKEPKNRGEQLDAVFTGNTISRLLELKILRYHFALTDLGHQWAYHWTYLGKLVLKKMGMSDLTIKRP
jgi:hypothetical protein